MAEEKVFVGGEFLITDAAPEDVFTPEDFTDEHKMIFETATDFVAKEIFPITDALEEKNHELVLSLLAKAGELGLLGTDVPEEYDGMGLDKVSTTIVTEALGVAGSFAVVYGAHTGIGSLPIVYFGTEEQKKKYLPKLASGQWCGAYCLTEPGAGSDAMNAKTKAVLSEDGKYYILNGEKMFITNAGWASSFIVYAKVNGEDFTGFIVEKDFPGVSTGKEEKKMGAHGSSTRPVILEDAKVPVENVLFEVGEGTQNRLQYPQYRPMETGSRFRGRMQGVRDGGGKIRQRPYSVQGAHQLFWNDQDQTGQHGRKDLHERQRHVSSGRHVRQ